MPRTADDKYTEVHIGEESDTEAVELDPERPFNILLVGDFSGRAWRKNPQSSFAPRLIDRDNFDEVMEDLQVSLKIHGIGLSFREIDDFHPDHIYQAAAPVFRDLEKRLDHPQAAKAKPAAAPRQSSGSLLDDIVADRGEPDLGAEVSVHEAGDLAAFIERVSRGHTEAKPTTAQQQRSAERNALAGDAMRAILHHPRLQALEAAWRAAFMLIRGLDTDGDLKVYLLDITLPELIAGMETLKKDLKKKGPWAVVAGNYSFGQSELDAQALLRIGRLATALRAPFLAEAHLDKEEDKAWTQLRHSRDARWIGLAMPRFLLRLPYGKETSAIESFPFEEMPKSKHSEYLWGNPSFFCAYLLGKSYLAHGWEMNPLERRIDGLPMHIYREDGEPVNKPCAEVLMTEHEAENLMEAGFMPLASMKREAAVLVVQFQSIADPVAPLSGLPQRRFDA